ncbi:hypothetical protein OF83DRAFT_1117831 [Amylostereum chailletii]|nr:hypothetical protein OF83DRAFT_1117831 [Amylostereum chailletii]
MKNVVNSIILLAFFLVKPVLSAPPSAARANLVNIFVRLLLLRVQVASFIYVITGVS